MKEPFADSPEFQRLLRDAPDADLVRVALEVARDAYPGLEPEPYEARIDALARRVRERCAATDKPRKVLGQINWVLFVEEGFQGNSGEYYDPRNSYINEVLDRKTGIPITLSILYQSVARRVGLAVDGMNLPAHFMLRVGCGEPDLFVDPFHDGALLGRADCEQRVSVALGRPVSLSEDQLAPCPTRQVVARMLRNLKSIYLQSHDYPSALPVQRRLAALISDDPDEQRDLGMLYFRLDRAADAIGPLQSYLDARPTNPAASDLHSLLRAARRDVAMRN